jgi:hypothetical protein
MTVTSYVLLALGAALTAFATWERLGRSHNARAWLKSPGPRAVRNHLFVYPPLGVLLLVFGAFPLIHDASGIAIPLRARRARGAGRALLVRHPGLSLSDRPGAAVGP